MDSSIVNDQTAITKEVASRAPSTINTAVDGIVQLVSFSLGGEEYGVEVLKVREIIRVPQITHMPNSPSYVEGIFNLRGVVIPIISLRSRFGLEARDADSATRVMVMDTPSGMTGFVVDSVSEVIRVSHSEIKAPPGVVSGSDVSDCITGVLNRGERLLILLDVNLMITDEMARVIGC